MSEAMKKPLIKNNKVIICISQQGNTYQLPEKIAKKYQIDESLIDAEKLFAKVNKKYTKPGALLRAIRIRENLTQIQMAKKIKVTQSDISQMENGTRKIGRNIAQRIEKLFGTAYRSFLE